MNSFYASPSSWTSGSVTLYASASDDTGVTGYYYSTSSSTPSASDSGWTTSTSKTVTTTGRTKWYCWAKDAAGNVSSYDWAYTRIDNTAPSTPTASAAGAGTISVSSSDSLSGIAGYYVSTSASSQTGGSWVSTTATSTTLTVSTAGTYYVFAKDAVGNVSAASSAVNVVLYTAPSTPSMAFTSTGTLTNGWYSKGGTITVTPAAAPVGGQTLQYQVNSTSGSWTTVPSGGIPVANTTTSGTTYYVRAVNASDSSLVSGTTSLTLKIDCTGPTVSASQNTTAWAQSKTVTISASDSQSGLHSTAYNFNNQGWSATSTYTVTAAGTYTVKARDALGNESSTTVTVTNIDRTGPSISGVSLTPSAWTNGTVQLTVSASDTQSSVNSYSFDGGSTWQSSASKSGFGNGTYTIKVKDNVGNTSTTTVTVSNIDTVAPTIRSFTASPAAWTNTDVTLTVDAVDNGGSGLHAQPYSYNNGTWTSSTTYTATSTGTYTVTVRDVAGNTGTASVEVYIDRVDPTIDSLTATDGPTNERQTVTLTAGDTGGSGLKDYQVDGGAWTTFSGTATFTLSENGTHTVSVRDNAGNVTTGSVEISNIFAPVTAATLSYADADPLTVGDSAMPSLSLTWSGSKPQGYDSLTYTIDNTDVASIDPDTGALTAKKTGTVTVTATVKNYSPGAYPDVTASYTVTLHDVAPEILTHPGNAIVFAGEEADFDVTASGLNLTFTWYRTQSRTGGTATAIVSGEDGFVVTSTANSSTLTLSDAKLKWGGWYFYCVAENTGGTATSKRGRLSVNTDIVEQDFRIEDSTAKNFTYFDLDGLLEGCTFKLVSLESEDTTVELTDTAVIDENYGVYGTDNANTKLGFSLVTDSGEVSLHDPDSIRSVSGIQGIKLYNAAAYTVREDRLFTLELSTGSGGVATFYLTVKGITSKTLNVDIPLSAVIELQPGLKEEGQTEALSVTNNQAYPLTVAVRSVAQQAGTDVALTLISQSTPFATTELTTAGVRLGVADSGGKTYYDPGAGTELDLAALTPGGSKLFRYFMEFAPMHSGQGGLTFGYQIGYRVAIPADDLK